MHRPKAHPCLYAVARVPKQPRPRADLFDLQIQVPAIGIRDGASSSAAVAPEAPSVCSSFALYLPPYLLNLRSNLRLCVRSYDILVRQRETSNGKKRPVTRPLRGHCEIF